MGMQGNTVLFKCSYAGQHSRIYTGQHSPSILEYGYAGQHNTSVWVHRVTQYSLSVAMQNSKVGYTQGNTVLHNTFYMAMQGNTIDPLQ